MKNAVIIGATTQVGFALCQKLISREVEVTGLEWSGKMDERAEEMLMEIGRNAFFHLQIDRTSNENFDVAFYFLDTIERLNQDNQEKYLAFAENASKLFFVSSYHNRRKNNNFKEQLNKKVKGDTKKTCFSIYLPMVIGPWQGEEEAVHKRLLEEKDEKDRQPIAIRDTDVLYVEDAAKAIYELSIMEEESQEVRFKNENPKVMNELMKELNLTFLDHTEHDDEWDEVTEYKVKQSLTTKESLQAQREQLRQKLKLE
ncbi:hypothetical protein AB685_13370 [Bacillus sp. LL01]|uniref:NAD(P)-dependent oxidoreductase n=1 Tax=Bacillus sp. LL01 TaxID=1665556 RepID=UPI00064D6E37|nr:NAD(P)-dependent oxidoreductase [Bacillus sp. LL01]KMJ57829.1 hypothetical protein AB685_13370 [Bacillus sp. LL01]